MSLLREIVATKAKDVALLRASVPVAAFPAREPLDVPATLRRASAPLRLIAEVKLRSPSAGPLSRALGPADRALAYAQAGAAMISVLCDARFFDGSWEHLTQARARLDAEGGGQVPLLAKEFVVDERQIEEAHARGADAVLLIARIVTPARLSELARAARAARVEPLIEVVDETELRSAIAAEARVVGVNARDLDTLEMNATRAARVCAAIPPELVAIHLSGLKSAADVARVARERIDAALIGEALMRQDDPRELLAAMVAETRAASPARSA